MGERKREFGIKSTVYKKIMIATDGSYCSRIAIDKGIELARLSGATVYVVMRCQQLTYLLGVQVGNRYVKP